MTIEVRPPSSPQQQPHIPKSAFSEVWERICSFLNDTFPFMHLDRLQIFRVERAAIAPSKTVHDFEKIADYVRYKMNERTTTVFSLDDLRLDDTDDEIVLIAEKLKDFPPPITISEAVVEPILDENQKKVGEQMIIHMGNQKVVVVTDWFAIHPDVRELLKGQLEQELREQRKRFRF